MSLVFNNQQCNTENKVLVKMCGFTRIEDIKIAIENQVNAIGLVFYTKSARYVDINTAKELVKYIPKSTQIVGLFVNESIDNIAKICKDIKIDLFQFHGDSNYETPMWCNKCSNQLNIPYIKVIGIDDSIKNISNIILNKYEEYANHKASGLLLDTKTNNYGGSGISFNWNAIPKQLLQNTDIPIIISGGINENNLLQAINLQPYAIDLSSAIEENIKGIKSHDKIINIMRHIQIKTS